MYQLKRYFGIFLISIIFPLTGIAQNIAGTWIGELNMGANKLELVFHIQSGNEGYEASMDIPMQGVKGAPAEIVFQDSTLMLTFPQFKIAYEGKLNENGDIHGEFNQSGINLPLILRKGEYVQNRPQEPHAPFSYYTEEVVFEAADGQKLAGTLSLPKQHGTYPVVIIISGSGPQNRDGEVFGHKPYLVLADHLTKNGIAVLRYDERGVGASGGSFETANLDMFAADANAALTYLQSRKDFSIQGLGLIGHSIGGLIAPKIASVNAEIDFLVLLAGPGIPGDQLMLSQKADFERKLGLTEFQIAQGQELMKGAYDIIRETSLSGQALKDTLHTFYFKKYGSMFPENQRNAIVEPVTSLEVVDLIRSDPDVYLSNVACPLLALNGDKDFQVLAAENLPAIEKAVRQNGNDQVTVMELQDINHLFQECETGLLDEYSKIEQTISPKVLDLITDWILKL